MVSTSFWPSGLQDPHSIGLFAWEPGSGPCATCVMTGGPSARLAGGRHTAASTLFLPSSLPASTQSFAWQTLVE